jgi:hypothetical protein
MPSLVGIAVSGSSGTYVTESELATVRPMLDARRASSSDLFSQVTLVSTTATNRIHFTVKPKRAYSTLVISANNIPNFQSVTYTTTAPATMLSLGAPEILRWSGEATTTIPSSPIAYRTLTTALVSRLPVMARRGRSRLGRGLAGASLSGPVVELERHLHADRADQRRR